MFIRDLPFKLILGAAARDTINNTKIGGSMSRRLVTNMANTPPRKAPRHANSPEIQYFGVFSRHTERRFLFSGAGFRYISGHPVLTSSGTLFAVVSSRKVHRWFNHKSVFVFFDPTAFRHLHKDRLKNCN